MLGGNATTTFAIALNAEGGVPPREIVLLPAGPVKGRDRRSWINDNSEAIVALFHEGGIDIPIDIEHATELKGPKGEPAPAVGWMKLHEKAGALCAQVDWTEEGKRLISSKAYRYISPAFAFDGQNRVRRLLSAGLTNKPNLDIPALNSETTVSFKAIAVALGLKDDAAEGDLVVAINSLKESNAALKTNVDRPDPAKFVPSADLQAALNRATTAEQKFADMDTASNTEKVTALIDGAVKDGKIAPASKAHYVALCSSKEGLAEVEKLIGSLPKITGKSVLEDKGITDPNGDLSAEQKAMCAQMDISEEDFKKSLATQAS